MAKYRVLDKHAQFTIEADAVSFNLEYGMMFFVRGENAEVVASCPSITPFLKLADPELEEED